MWFGERMWLVWVGLYMYLRTKAMPSCQGTAHTRWFLGAPSCEGRTVDNGDQPLSSGGRIYLDAERPPHINRYLIHRSCGVIIIGDRTLICQFKASSGCHDSTPLRPVSFTTVLSRTLSDP
jgi:hypothetical protein